MFLNRVKLWKVIGAAVAIFITLTVCLLLSVVYTTLSADAARQALEKQMIAVRTGALLMTKDIAGTTIAWSAGDVVDHIEMPALPPFPTHDLIDNLTRTAGAAATIFAYDAAKDDFTRVTTSIKKADGSRAVGTDLGKASPAYAAIKGGHSFTGEAAILGAPYLTVYTPIKNPAGQVIGILFAGIPEAAVAATKDGLVLKISLLGLLLAAVMSAGASWLVLRLIRPVTQLASLMERISRDDLAEEIPYAAYGNEVGSIARAVVILKDSAVTRIALEQNKGIETAERAARQERIEALINDFRATTRTALGAVNKTVEDLLATAGSLGAGALRTVQDAGAASSASCDATGNVQTVASATEELAASIGEISAQIQRTGAVVADAARGTRDADVKINRLATGATKIGEVVTLIRAIAEQTNLLALNATIEAARAGEGRQGLCRRCQPRSRISLARLPRRQKKSQLRSTTFRTRLPMRWKRFRLSAPPCKRSIATLAPSPPPSRSKVRPPATSAVRSTLPRLARSRWQPTSARCLKQPAKPRWPPKGSTKTRATSPTRQSSSARRSTPSLAP